MNLKLKMPRLSASTIMSIIFVMIVLFELWVAYNSLFVSITGNPPASAASETVISADVNGYRQTVNVLNSRTNYVPPAFDYTNSNPFQYGQ